MKSTRHDWVKIGSGITNLRVPVINCPINNNFILVLKDTWTCSDIYWSKFSRSSYPFEIVDWKNRTYVLKWWDTKSISIFTYKQWLLSIDMRTNFFFQNFKFSWFPDFFQFNLFIGTRTKKINKKCLSWSLGHAE